MLAVYNEINFALELSKYLYTKRNCGNACTQIDYLIIF